MEQRVRILSDNVRLEGELTIPKAATGIVVFAHGSGSSHKSPRNQRIASMLREEGLGTLLFDLLTENEASDPDNVFDIDFLAHRLSDATAWLRNEMERGYSLGYFGASTGAAAALSAAATDPTIKAVVSRGGRPDLALRHLGDVRAPTLLLVGGRDYGIIELNEKAYHLLRCEKSFKIISRATHLFEEPGALEQVAALAADWFTRHFTARQDTPPVTDPIIFPTREDAGRMLAGRLHSYQKDHPIVLGIPRGGLPVARQIADALEAALDVVVVRKLGAPGQPELGIGAVVDGDEPQAVFNRDIIESLGVPDKYLEEEVARQTKEVKRREVLYRNGREKIALEGRTVIVVDDGIATGSSVRAALRGVRRSHPKRLILAVPVAPAETLETLQSDTDEIVCLETPAEFYAVGQFYRDFHQVNDQEVQELLSPEKVAAPNP